MMNTYIVKSDHLYTKSLPVTFSQEMGTSGVAVGRSEDDIEGCVDVAVVNGIVDDVGIRVLVVCEFGCIVKMKGICDEIEEAILVWVEVKEVDEVGVMTALVELDELDVAVKKYKKF